MSFDGVRGDAGGALLASYRKHQWQVEGFDYFRLDCTARVAIHFERLRERSTSYGPFERLSAVNGLTTATIACSASSIPVLVVTDITSAR